MQRETDALKDCKKKNRVPTKKDGWKDEKIASSKGKRQTAEVEDRQNEKQSI